jgi:hypothetical protein
MDICSRATMPPMNSSKRYPYYWKTISPSRKMQNHICQSAESSISAIEWKSEQVKISCVPKIYLVKRTNLVIIMVSAGIINVFKPVLPPTSMHITPYSAHSY